MIKLLFEIMRKLFFFIHSLLQLFICFLQIFGVLEQDLWILPKIKQLVWNMGQLF